jgi:hypothetical protein
MEIRHEKIIYVSKEEQTIANLKLSLKANFHFEITFEKEHGNQLISFECEQAQEIYLLFKDYFKIKECVHNKSNKI